MAKAPRMLHVLAYFVLAGVTMVDACDGSASSRGNEATTKRDGAAMTQDAAAPDALPPIVDATSKDGCVTPWRDPCASTWAQVVARFPDVCPTEPVLGGGYQAVCGEYNALIFWNPYGFSKYYFDKTSGVLVGFYALARGLDGYWSYSEDFVLPEGARHNSECMPPPDADCPVTTLDAGVRSDADVGG